MREVVAVVRGIRPVWRRPARLSAGLLAGLPSEHVAIAQRRRDLRLGRDGLEKRETPCSNNRVSDDIVADACG